ncbi:phosphonate C-P lyase system protein PhnG [Brachybacterium sp. ACRRE]|uniref:phosphonate C-P lyase system protein PhnG n=1 Tax=Brachybacterium sp. ACRRE TaxID=2918184 RepID=UPI001EF2248C|nr:phosphonate C-P lyase system protein PhnG [Brachybacterium sp. ACRRE]
MLPSTAVPPDRSDPAARRRWMRTLALAPAASLAERWPDWAPTVRVRAVRGPEAGLVMVRGRIDAAGDRFNLGEATVTRATVRVDGDDLAREALGSAWVLGTDLDHAWHAAAFDALLSDPGTRERVLEGVVLPLEREQEARDAGRHRDARATQVDFFTVSREHA